MYAQDPQDFIREFSVNFQGPYYLMRLLIPKFREQGSGCVLNIASRAGTVIIPYSTSYCASKAALINLTGCVQKEMDIEGLQDIHLYSLHPGGIKSAMTLKSTYECNPTKPFTQFPCLSNKSANTRPTARRGSMIRVRRGLDKQPSGAGAGALHKRL